MKAHRPLALAAPLVAVAWTGWGRPAQDPVAHARPARSESCSLCHPGARKALAWSIHGRLLRDPAHAAEVCSACHGDQTEHVRSAVDPAAPRVAATPVAAAACAACHDRPLDPAAAAHPWSPQLDRDLLPAAGAPRPALPPVGTPLPPVPSDLTDDGRIAGMDWSLAARFGYRFVQVVGSRPRYETDLNLDRGFRLTDFELTGRGAGGGLADRLAVRVTSLDDPYMRLDGELARDRTYRAAARFDRDRFKYRAAGDFHRVDRRTQTTAFDLGWEAAADVELFVGFSRRQQEGFWLTNRIGDRNTTPQTTVAGVASPRVYDADLLESGVTTEIGGWNTTAVFEYRDESSRDTWQFARAAAANPSFPDSELFTSATTTRGPGGRLVVGRRWDGLSVELSGRLLDLDRRIRGSGERRGFDVAEFRTTTTSFSRGGAETYLVDGTATLDLTAAAAVVVDGRWLDHREDLDIDQTDTTVYPSLNNTTVVGIDRLQQTRQRVFEGSVALQLEPFAGLTTTAGWGWSREWLRVPDLEAGDADFRRGAIHTDGALVDGEWRPNASWVAGLSWRQFGQNGPQLHEVIDDRTRRLRGRLRYQRPGGWVELFAENRHKENDVSRTVVDGWTSGVTVHAEANDDLDLTVGYSFANLDSRTLTSFYFDPSPTPVPTFVGFAGDTHTVSGDVAWQLARHLAARFGGAYTGTRGTFDVAVFDVHADLALELCTGAELGMLWRQVDYREDVSTGSGDDFTAYLTMVYVRTRL